MQLSETGFLMFEQNDG